MNRRQILAAAPAFSFAGLMATGAVAAIAETETPVTKLFREWAALDALEAEVYATSDDEDEHGAATDRKIAVEQLMRVAPKLTFEDVALTLAACTDFGLAEIGWERAAEMRAEARALVAA